MGLAQEVAPQHGGTARTQARVAGVLWLIVIVTGLFSEIFVRGSLIVRNDGAATSALILQHQVLFRFGVISDITATACYLAIVALLYGLLKPVGRALSAVSAAFGLAGSAISGLNMLAYFAPLIILTNAEYFSAFTPQQLQNLVLLQVKLYGFGANIALIFFSGVYLILIGILIFRSKFLPTSLGALLAFAGVCYLIGSVSSFINPGLARAIGTYIYLPGGVAELAIAIWLVARGVNIQCWNAADAAARLRLD